MKHANRSSLFLQYLLFYFIAVFVPVIIACISLYLSFQSFEEEVIQSNQASILLTQQSLDIKIKELENICLVLEQDPSLTKYALATKQLESIESLKNTVSLQDFLDNIIIKIRSEDYLYSAHGCYSLDDQKYQGYIRNLERNGYSSSEWQELANTVTSPTYWPVNAVTSTPDYVYLFVPMNTSFQSSGENSSRTIVFLINHDFIQKLFYASQTNAKENILLLDADMNLLSYLTPHASADSITDICEYLRTFPETAEDGSYKNVNLDGQDNLMFISHSSETGLYYVRFLPEYIVYEPLHTAITYTIIILILDIIVGIMLITIGMRRSYTPIRALADWLQNTHSEQMEMENELTFFKKVFDDVFRKNTLLSQTIDNSRYELTNHLLTALIRGNFSTEESFYNACQNLGICLDKKYWAVCSLLIENLTDIPANAVCYDNLLKVMCTDLPDNLRFQVIDSLLDGKLLVVLNSDSDDPVFYRTVMTDIKKRLFKQKGLITSIGIGSIYDSYELVGKSYIESVNALDYRLIYGKNCVITPDIYNSHTSESNYPTEDLNLLYSALMSQNEEMANTVIQRIHDYTKSESCSLHAAKYICYDTFSVLKKMPKFKNMGYCNTLSQTLNITSLINYETIDDFFVSFLEIVHTTMNTVDKKEDFSNSDIGQELIEYIYSHCFTYDFQISSMANHFSISPQYMRKLFKNHTGIGISEYISNIKLEKAMQLLRETDMNLQNIVNEIGNTDVSGFVRSFKKKTGITPGEYRKINRI